MNDYEKMKSIIDEIDVLIEKKVSAGSPEFQAWENKTLRFLIYYYGEDAYETKDFRDRSFLPMMFSLDAPQSLFINTCKRGLQGVKAVFLNYLMDIEEKGAKTPVQQQSLNSLFIVHGHDGELRESVARIIEKQGINPIILKEQPNRGATIIEKIEANSEVSAAICLYTADDVGKEKTDEKYNDRARQNVVFEAGYFIGKFGRSKVIIVADKSIEMPSDLQGIVYTDARNWELDVLKELKAMGYSIDLNKLYD